MFELAIAVLSLRKAHVTMGEPISTDWFDEVGQTERAAVIMLLAAWNDAIDWAEHTIEQYQLRASSYVREGKAI